LHQSGLGQDAMIIEDILRRGWKILSGVMAMIWHTQLGIASYCFMPDRDPSGHRPGDKDFPPCNVESVADYN
jgi:hypothetical protein